MRRFAEFCLREWALSSLSRMLMAMSRSSRAPDHTRFGDALGLCRLLPFSGFPARSMPVQVTAWCFGPVPSFRFLGVGRRPWSFHSFLRQLMWSPFESPVCARFVTCHCCVLGLFLLPSLALCHATTSYASHVSTWRPGQPVTSRCTIRAPSCAPVHTRVLGLFKIWDPVTALAGLVTGICNYCCPRFWPNESNEITVQQVGKHE